MKHSIITILMVLFFNCVKSQTTFTGVVIDAKTKLPLAFASVQLLNTNKGTLTDIDGKFSITPKGDENEIKVSYLAYNTKTFKLTEKYTIIELDHSSKVLEDVIIDGKINPAHRIIDSFMKYKERNNPYNYQTFKYNAYTKAGIVAQDLLWKNLGALNADSSSSKTKDSLKEVKRLAKELKDREYRNKLFSDTIKYASDIRKLRIKDSIENIQDKKDSTLVKMMKENYIAFTESYTERIYKQSNRSKETVIGSKFTGIDNPNFSFISSNFQPFGLYEDYIRMINVSYQSPVGPGTKKDYRLTLKDKIIKGDDTTFIILFRPKKGKNFNGLSGVVHINSNGWGLENIIAQPYKDSGSLMTFKLQQQYAQVDGKWFPKQLNTVIDKRNAETNKSMIFWDNKSYFSNIKINIPIDNKEFGDLSLDFNDGAGKMDDSLWAKFRTDSLDDKAKNTLKAYELLPKETKRFLNAIPQALEIFALKAIPWGKVDLPFKNLISLNRYEGIRLGVGFRTNSYFSKNWTFAANAAWGFRDRSLKYGGSVGYEFSKRINSKLTLSFRQDLEEPGSNPYLNEADIFQGYRSLRKFLTYRMDSIQEWKLAFSTKVVPNLEFDAWVENEKRSAGHSDYLYRHTPKPFPIERFTNTELGVGFRYTFGERYTKLGRAKVLRKNPSTQFIVGYSKGIKDIMGGEFEYDRLSFKINHTYRTRKFGETKWQLIGGQIWGDVPNSYLFNTPGARSERTRADIAFISNHFQTVQLYEFLNDRFLHFSWEQNFGPLLFRSKSVKFKPEFSIVNNVAFGWLKNKKTHLNVPFKTMEDGMFESGFLVKNLYRKLLYDLVYFGVGVGGFYRYGFNSYPKFGDNFAAKIVFNVSF